MQQDQQEEMRQQATQAIQRGLFIVFEGLDRSGKSTQSSRVAKYFKEELQRKTETMSFPKRDTNGGKMLNDYLQNRENKLNDKAVHTLFAFNRWEMVPDIIQMLKNGTNIICDRYAFSGVAYSAAKGLDFEWCKNSDRGLVTPDLTFYIDVAPDVLAQRGNYGDERYERLDFQTKVGHVYDRFKQDFKDSEHWATIDASNQSVEELTAQIIDKINAYENDVLPTVDFDQMCESLFIDDKCTARRRQ
eukprot:403366547